MLGWYKQSAIQHIRSVQIDELNSQMFWQKWHAVGEQQLQQITKDFLLTAMVNIVRRTMRDQDEARRLLFSLYETSADILPDYESNKLTVRLHQPANRCSVVTINNLCRELNTTATRFPGTNLRLIYDEMVS